MKARDFRGQHAAVLHIAKAAQRAAIKYALVTNYSGGRKELNEWGDDQYSWSWFGTGRMIAQGKEQADVCNRRNWSTTGTPLRYLKDLAAGGFLSTRKYSGIRQFRFNRATCDAMAAEVRAELLAEGIQTRASK